MKVHVEVVDNMLWFVKNKAFSSWNAAMSAIKDRMPQAYVSPDGSVYCDKDHALKGNQTDVLAWIIKTV